MRIFGKKKEEQPITADEIDDSIDLPKGEAQTKSKPTAQPQKKEEPTSAEFTLSEDEMALTANTFANDEDVKIFLACERGRVKYNILLAYNAAVEKKE